MIIKITMIKKTIKFITFSITAFLLAANFALAQEENISELLDQSATSVAEETDQSSPEIPTAAEIQLKLDLLEKTAPVTLRLYSTESLASGLEVNVKARTSLLARDNAGNLNFKWFLKKDGLDQAVESLRQGKGKDQFSFIPASSGNYEVKVQVVDSQGNTKESPSLAIPVGDNLLLTFEPLKPVNGQKVLVSAAGFSSVANYQWYLDGQKQNSNSSTFEFMVTKEFEQFHKIKATTTNKQGIVAYKEIIIPVYRSEVVIKTDDNDLAIASQANSVGEFLVKGKNPVILKAETSNFSGSDQVNYIWYVNGQEFDQGVGKKSIFIDPQDERLGKNFSQAYQVSVLAVSPDAKHIAAANVSMSRINPNSSLAAVNPEKLSSQPLLAQSKSFFTSFNNIRKLVLPLLIIMFAVVIALGNTQPEKIE